MNQRIEHIDSIRAIAVLLMVMVHAAATWGPPSTTQPSLLVYIVSGMGGLAAPLFVAVFGWGCVRGTSTAKQRMIRASFFFVAQTAINLSSPHLFEPFSPGVLTLFGALILSQPLWLKPLQINQENSNGVFLLVLVATLLFATFCSTLMGPSDWNSRITTNGVGQWFEHALLTGTYPVVPWVVFAMLGAWIGVQGGEEKTFPQSLGSLALVSGGLACCAFTLAYALHNELDWAAPTGDALLTFFPANAPFLVAAITGVVLIWLIAQNITILGLEQLSKRSLSVYLVHFIPIGLFHALNESYSFSVWHSMVVILTYTAVWVPIANAWGRLAPRRDIEHALAWLVKR